MIDNNAFVYTERDMREIIQAERERMRQIVSRIESPKVVNGYLVGAVNIRDLLLALDEDRDGGVSE